VKDPNAAQKAKARKTKDLLLRFARHLLNPTDMPLLTWGVVGMDLLAEVRELMPKDYDRVVKAKGTT